MNPFQDPATLLGLPGISDPAGSVPLLRYLLLALALVWAWCASWGRRVPTLAAGLLFVWTGLVFWTLSFGRPYGLLEPSAFTREAAYAAQYASGWAPHGFVAGEPFTAGPWARLTSLGVSFEALVEWPSLLPLVTLPAMAFALLAAWRRPEAPLAATLLFAFSTTDLEALRGTGIVTGLWAHPAASLGVPLLLVALLFGVCVRRALLPLAVLAGLLGLILCWEPHPTGMSLATLPSAMLLDPWPWPLLAAFALRSRRDPGACACLLGGAILLGASSLGLPLDAWPGFAVFRVGLLLAAAAPLGSLLGRAATLVTGRWPQVGNRPGLGVALLLLAFLPGSFLTWWSPLELDPMVHASQRPVHPIVAATAAWMRQNLPPSAVVVASSDYAPMVLVMARRQVLRAPQLLVAPDETRRERLESSIFRPGPLGERNAAHYGVSHVLLGPGDARRWGFGGERDPPVPGRFRLVYLAPKGFRVYALERWNGPD